MSLSSFFLNNPFGYIAVLFSFSIYGLLRRLAGEWSEALCIVLSIILFLLIEFMLKHLTDNLRPRVFEKKKKKS